MFVAGPNKHDNFTRVSDLAEILTVGNRNNSYIPREILRRARHVRYLPLSRPLSAHLARSNPPTARAFPSA